MVDMMMVAVVVVWLAFVATAVATNAVRASRETREVRADDAFGWVVGAMVAPEAIRVTFGCVAVYLTFAAATLAVVGA